MWWAVGQMLEAIYWTAFALVAIFAIVYYADKRLKDNAGIWLYLVVCVAILALICSWRPT